MLVSIFDSFNNAWLLIITQFKFRGAYFCQSKGLIVHWNFTKKNFVLILQSTKFASLVKYRLKTKNIYHYAKF